MWTHKADVLLETNNFFLFMQKELNSHNTLIFF